MNIPGTTARQALGMAALALLLGGCAGAAGSEEARDGALKEPTPLATAHAVAPASEPSPAAGPDGPAEKREAEAATPSSTPAPTTPAPQPSGPEPIAPGQVDEPAPEPAGQEAPPVELPDSLCAFPDPTMNAVCRSALGR
ncbi:hypothetical protein [Streptomyces profundus]|uniref:hypothetical protein n=1 Tax=Streptomyces profundus TaxID=2867410 RepID=UPI001D168963|nr:hypothetical protein [Streptomyces sp. MA3_2.13]UED83342.1 hypothetical protein K4G22_03250 [Streptomyces sp. MA3_2.13]